MEINYDNILIKGSANDLRNFSYENGVVIDWKQEDDLIVKDFASRIENENLSAEFTDEGLLVNYNGTNFDIPLSFSLKDRYITIRGLMFILKDKYEIRVFDNSLGSDTHIFYIKSKEWWAFMDNHFPEEIRKVFFKIDSKLDFNEGRDKFYILGYES